MFEDQHVTEVMPIEEAHRPAAANGDPNPNYYFAAAGLPLF
jgi:hypothetical protein